MTTETSLALRKARRRVITLVTRTATIVFPVGLAAVLLALTIPRAIGYQMLIVRTGSMTGTASVGSLVLARPVDPTDIETGDVILLQRSRDGVRLAPVLHRVIEVVHEAGDMFVRTKGDANPQSDPGLYALRGPTVSPVLVVPRLGFAVSVVTSPVGWFALVVAPAVLLSAIVLCRIWGSPPTAKEVPIVAAAQ